MTTLRMLSGSGMNRPEKYSSTRYTTFVIAGAARPDVSAPIHRPIAQNGTEPIATTPMIVRIWSIDSSTDPSASAAIAINATAIAVDSADIARLANNDANGGIGIARL